MVLRLLLSTALRVLERGADMLDYGLHLDAIFDLREHCRPLLDGQARVGEWVGGWVSGRVF